VDFKAFCGMHFVTGMRTGIKGRSRR
jgi:hypothetical protein